MENHDLESRRLEGRAELRLLEVGGVRVRTRTLTCGSSDPGFDVATLERCVACVPATLEDCLSGIDEAASGDRSSPPEERELRARVMRGMAELCLDRLVCRIGEEFGVRIGVTGTGADGARIRLGARPAGGVAP